MNEVELNAWKAFKDVCNSFLGNFKEQNYTDLVEQLISSYGALGCNMSIKMHF
jgi:hypothetical protein